jgi:hypothetical protein
MFDGKTRLIHLQRDIPESYCKNHTSNGTFWRFWFLDEITQMLVILI